MSVDRLPVPTQRRDMDFATVLDPVLAGATEAIVAVAVARGRRSSIGYYANTTRLRRAWDV
jgi:hypothetical protein